MTRSVRRYLAFGMAILGAAAIVAASPPVALAEGGISGDGGGTLTGPGGINIGSVSQQIDGKENVPRGAPGAPGCITGGCGGSLSTSTGIATGPSTQQIGAPGLQITPTIKPPQPNAIACITAQCHGSGSLSTSGGVKTPIVGATGGLNGYIHG